MNKLIIVTGISGSGKSTISKHIYNHYETSTIISMDMLKENIYELVGFYNCEQKQELKEIVYETFKSILKHCMKRNDKIIIIEYPFNKNWELILKEYIEKYNYEAITINIKCKDYDLIYDRLNERNNSINRHPAHSLNSYNPKYKEDYKSTNELEYNKQKENYYNDKYTSIQLGQIISFENNEEKNIDRLICQLDEIIYEA